MGTHVPFKLQDKPSMLKDIYLQLHQEKEDEKKIRKYIQIQNINKSFSWAIKIWVISFFYNFSAVAQFSLKSM